MKSKQSKAILLSIIAIIIIIIVISGVIVMLSKKEEKIVENNETEETIEQEQKEVLQKGNLIVSQSKFYEVTRIVKQYYHLLNKSNYVNREGKSYADEISVKEGIYNLLDKEYIKEENITAENIYEHVPNVEETLTFVPTDIKVSEGFAIDKYLVNGILMSTSNIEQMAEINIFVNIDNKNNTFSVEPINEKGEEIKIENLEIEIEANDFNEYKLEIKDPQALVKERFENLKLLILRKSEKLYNMLDEEYKNKKFGTYEEYVKYIDTNYERLSTMYLTKYKTNEYEEYNQYICIDNKDKYYIFNVKSANDVGIMLDTYTLDLPEFTEKYNKASDSTKVGYNVERFISAINDKDYKFAYNLLDEVYRESNFKTVESFESYIKRNLYEKNEIEHQNIEKQGNNYIYEVNIKNANDKTVNGKTITVIMKLLEGTDFVMSFSM